MLDSLKKIKIDAMEELDRVKDLNELKRLESSIWGKRRIDPIASRYGKVE